MATFDPNLSLHGDAALYRWGAQPLTDGSVAYLQPNGGLGEANVGLVVGDGASCVIDTCWDPTQAARMLTEFDPWLADNPITAVVNTHSNGDHWWGNSLMPAEATIVTSKASLGAMRAESPLALTAMRASLGLACRLPLPGRLGRTTRQGSHEFAPFDFASVRRRFPDTTFTGRTELNIGGRVLELREVGPAHTAGDLMVFDHGSGVVFGGDILFIDQTPIMWEGPAQNWVAALEQIIAFGPTCIVPGHGPLATLGQVESLRTYFQWLAERAEHFHTKGTSAQDATLEMLRSDEFSTSNWATWRRPEVLVAGVGAEYRRLNGKSGSPSQFAMANTMIGIRSVAEALAR